MSKPVNYPWTEVHCPEDGHRNFVLNEIAERYLAGDGKYVLVAHHGDDNHFICGIFHDLKSCLLARGYSNLGLAFEKSIKLDRSTSTQAHKLDGTPITEFVYDIATNAIREL